MDHPIRVILDTNLWISYLISSSLIVLDQLIEDEDLVLLFNTVQWKASINKRQNCQVEK